jgi:peptidoglycan hydrolase-like protein with peptidoglycan-binding domain
LVQKGILLGLALCAGAWLATPATTSTTTPTKNKTVKKRSHAVPTAAKTTAAKTTTAKTTTTARSRAVASKTTKGKKTVRRASAPRQLAPTKERYQQIQQALASKGYYSGEPNGVWGQDSMEALKRFQAEQNLTPDGKLTSLSLIALGLGPKRLSAQSPAQPPHPTQPQ